MLKSKGVAVMNAGIIGIGRYVPEKVVTNFDFEKMMDTSDEWIRTRTGIEERRICSRRQDTSDMAYKAAKNALENAGITARRNWFYYCCNSYTRSTVS